MSRLIISLYDSFETAHAAIAKLLEIGYCQDAISLVANRSASERDWGMDRSKSWFYLSRPCAFSLPGIGPVLVSGFLTADPDIQDGAQQSLVRALESRMVPQGEANVYAESVRRSGVLVLIRAERTNSTRALSILERYCPVDTQELEDHWRKAGWTGFNDTASPLQTNGFRWPNCITSLPGDALYVGEPAPSWPRSIVGKRK